MTETLDLDELTRLYQVWRDTDPADTAHGLVRELELSRALRNSAPALIAAAKERDALKAERAEAEEACDDACKTAQERRDLHFLAERDNAALRSRVDKLEAVARDSADYLSRLPRDGAWTNEAWQFAAELRAALTDKEPT